MEESGPPQDSQSNTTETFMSSRGVTQPYFISFMKHPHCPFQACMKTCYQKCLLKECNCGDNTFPMNASNIAYRNITKHQEIKPCNVSDPQTGLSIGDVKLSYSLIMSKRIQDTAGCCVAASPHYIHLFSLLEAHRATLLV